MSSLTIALIQGPPVFLHGGGDQPDQRAVTFGPFVKAARAHSAGPLALVVAEATAAEARESYQAYAEIFASLIAADQLIPVLVSPGQPLRHAMLEAARPSGVFVCGGTTPLYHQALCLDLDWLAYVRATGIPYGGTSAGAAIAAQSALLGGWRAERGGQVRPILFQGASEGLELLTIQPGLGLVPFTVEVHASQLGTLTRLIQALELGWVSEGWAIDENTLLRVWGEEIQVQGQGHAYHLQRAEGGALTVAIHTASAA
jgi:cyanophycinase